LRKRGGKTSIYDAVDALGIEHALGRRGGTINQRHDSLIKKTREKMKLSMRLAEEAAP
jgi:hypothetical protein